VTDKSKLYMDHELPSVSLSRFHYPILLLIGE